MTSESKERWKEQREQKRKAYEALQKKKRTRRIILYAVLILIVAIVAFFIIKKVAGPGKYDSFAQCLTEEGMVFYGTDWCSHCQEQKQLFGNSFKYVQYVNCDIGLACDKAGVEVYPTWGKDNKLFSPGKKSLAGLSKITGCKLP